MKQIYFIALLWATNSYAQVGIGTTNPSANAVLDVSSANKGLMLPRLADTTSVSNPSAGLMIFNMQAKAPAFHDGAKWNNLSAANAVADSVTYTITSANNGFVNGTYPLAGVSHGISNTGSSLPNFQDVTFTKLLDANSNAIARAVSVAANLGSMVIEIKSYTPGAANPNFSIKLSTSVRFPSYQVSVSGGALQESVAVYANVFGFKDWIRNVSFPSM